MVGFYENQPTSEEINSVNDFSIYETSGLKRVIDRITDELLAPHKEINCDCPDDCVPQYLEPLWSAHRNEYYSLFHATYGLIPDKYKIMYVQTIRHNELKLLKDETRQLLINQFKDIILNSSKYQSFKTNIIKIEKQINHESKQQESTKARI